MRAWSRNVRYFLLLPSARAAPGNRGGQRKGPALLPRIPLLLGSSGATAKSQAKPQGWNRDTDLMLSAQTGKEMEKKPARIEEILFKD